MTRTVQSPDTIVERATAILQLAPSEHILQRSTMAAAPVAPWPLYDLVLNIPHPGASKQAAPIELIGSPEVDEKQLPPELAQIVPQIVRFAFPEAEATPSEAPLNATDQYAMQNQAFCQFTFSLQLSNGLRLHGHVRRSLPVHPLADGRYDVGRRSERAWVLLTRATGADLLYTAVLK